MSTLSLILLTIVAQVAPVAADPQAKAQARVLLGEGTKLYQRGSVAGALEKFLAAYAAFPSPKLLFNIGQANRDLGRPVEALQAFEKFLADATDASADTIADAHRSAAELQKKLGRIRIDCDMAGAEVSVDGKDIGLTPLRALIWATPGRHQVTARHTGAAPAIENVEVTAVAISTVTMRLGAPAAAAATPATDLQAPRPSSPDEGWWLGRKWTWVAAGSTVLFAVGAGIAGGLMKNKVSSLKESCGSASDDPNGCSQSQVDSVDLRKNMANVFWGLTAAAAATTGVLFFVEGRPVTVAPMAGGITGFSAGVRY
jgi:hypothetical protein